MAANVQTSFIESLSFKVSVTTGVTSGASVAVSGIAAEDVVLAVIEFAGAGAGAVTAPNNRTAAITGQGANYLQLDTDTSGDHLLVMWHNKT